MKMQILGDAKWEEAVRAGMRRLGRMFLTCALCSGCAVNGYAQSFIIAVSPSETQGSTVIAGRPHLMTVTRDSGSGIDAAYTGSHTLDGSYTDVTSSGTTQPDLCAPNGGGNCAPTGACQTVGTSSTPLPALTFTGGVANFCLVMPDVGTFSVGMSEAGVSGTGPALTSRPDHFSLSNMSLKKRSELACPGSTFAYMGEPIEVSFDLAAKNQSDVVTPHYSGARFTSDITQPSTWTTFGSNDSMGLWMVATNYAVGAGTCKAMFSNATPWATSFACSGAGNPASIDRAAGPRVTILTTPVPTSDWVSNPGTGTYTVNVVLERADKADGAYNTLSIGVAPRDADGVTLNTLDMDADNDSVNERAIVGSTSLRYGRFRIANTYGSELLPLPMEVQAQYWNGLAYTGNTDDNCTPLAGANFSYSQGPGAAISTSISGSGTLSGGTGKITLAKPSPTPAGKGAANVSSAIPYLPGSGRATFGVYRSGPVIYRRELHY